MRRFSLASLAAAASIAAIPSGASAATQIGETFIPTENCSSDFTILQSTSPGGQYAAPTDGVITRWSFRADDELSADVDKLKFKVGRATGTANEFTMIGESALVDPVFDTLNSYFVQIPVLAGDIIGNYWNAGNTLGADCARADSDYSSHFHSGDVVPPTTATFTAELGFQFDVSALLEPDCDKDGLGDETQDPDLSSCVGAAAIPLTCKGQRSTISGTPSNDQIVGTPNRDVILGLGGDDNISGLGGDDVICAGEGNDTVTGGRGKDNLNGQSGNDRLNGSADKDTLKGKAGNDVLKGGPARDILKGGKGRDSLFGQGGSDRVVGQGGKDTCFGGGGGNDTAKSCEKQKGF